MRHLKKRKKQEEEQKNRAILAEIERNQAHVLVGGALAAIGARSRRATHRPANAAAGRDRQLEVALATVQAAIEREGVSRPADAARPHLAPPPLPLPRPCLPCSHRLPPLGRAVRS